MSTVTAINGFQIPQLTDAANIETAIHPFANAVDARVLPVFANATARNSAITSPVAGQLSYRTDQDAIEAYNGTNWILVNPADVFTNGASMSAGSDTTTSATYVNMAGTGSTTSVVATKKSTGTRLLVEVAMSFFVTVNDTTTRFGVNVNAVDYDIFRLAATVPVNVHVFISGFNYISGLAAGTYTIQGRWRRDGGTGTCSRDVNDWFNLRCREVK